MNDQYTTTTERMIAMLQEKLDTLTAERDEARREVCTHEADTAEDQREYARQRGWDCCGTNTCKEAQHDLETDAHTE